MDFFSKCCGVSSLTFFDDNDGMFYLKNVLGEKLSASKEKYEQIYEFQLKIQLVTSLIRINRKPGHFHFSKHTLPPFPSLILLFYILPVPQPYRPIKNRIYYRVSISIRAKVISSLVFIRSFDEFRASCPPTHWFRVEFPFIYVFSTVNTGIKNGIRIFYQQTGTIVFIFSIS